MTDTEFEEAKTNVLDCLKICKKIEQSNLESLEKSDLIQVVKHLNACLINSNNTLLAILDNTIKVYD